MFSPLIIGKGRELFVKANKGNIIQGILKIPHIDWFVNNTQIMKSYIFLLVIIFIMAIVKDEILK